MKLRTLIDIIDSRYVAEISIADTTATEEELMRSFGEPEISVGGSFSGSLTRPGDGTPTSVSFTLPDEQRRLISEFPVKKIFDLDDDSDNDIACKVWANEIINRITTAKTDLLAKSKPYEGETLETI